MTNPVGARRKTPCGVMLISCKKKLPQAISGSAQRLTDFDTTLSKIKLLLRTAAQKGQTAANAFDHFLQTDEFAEWFATNGNLHAIASLSALIIT
jgi:hypothetical protein